MLLTPSLIGRYADKLKQVIPPPAIPVQPMLTSAAAPFAPLTTELLVPPVNPFVGQIPQEPAPTLETILALTPNSTFEPTLEDNLPFTKLFSSLDPSSVATLGLFQSAFPFDEEGHSIDPRIDHNSPRMRGYGLDSTINKATQSGPPQLAVHEQSLPKIDSIEMEHGWRGPHGHG